MSKCGVILCECNGALERRISLQELNRFIHNVTGLNIVIGNNLCEPHELSLLLEKSEVYPSIIGACDRIHSHAHFWQAVETNKFNPFFTEIVNILGEIESNFSDIEVSNRIKLLLNSQISKVFCRESITNDNQRLRFPTSKDKITRRNLLGTLSPQYEIVPSISNSECTEIKCKLCAYTCPAHAIADANGKLKINKSTCTRCGACVTSCPREAISYPGYSLTEMEREIEGLLSRHVELPSRILSIVCQSCLNVDDPNIKAISPYLFSIKVPSPAIVSPLLLLYAFNLGADGIVLIHDQQHCNSKISTQTLNNNLHFIRQLFQRWGIDKNRIGYIDQAYNPEAHEELHRFTERIITSGHTPFSLAAGSMTFEGMYSIAAIIREMNAKLQLSEEGLISGEEVPFGSVNIDQSHCTGCCLCVQSCPTGALSTRISDNHDSINLEFQHNKCIACGICVATCPEKCVSNKKVLDFAVISGSKNTIFESEFVSCHNCGRPYATKSMIDILKQRLDKIGTFNPSWSEYCPSCRVSIKQKR